MKTNKNLIINACAGSGKTTLCLQMAQSMPERQFLLLVYNRRLMEETKKRCKEHGLKNISVYNYHRLGFDFYTSECATDEGLKRIVEDDMTIKDNLTLPPFDMLLLDEQQDMTPIYYRFVQKVLRDSGFSGGANGISARFCLVGDKRQSIYGYNNADWRFLTMAGQEAVFGKLAGSRDWEEVRLDETHRATKEIVKFWNEQMLKPSGQQEIRAAARGEERKEKCRPRYIICDSKSDVPFGEVERLINQHNLKPQDIGILAYSSRPPMSYGRSRRLHLPWLELKHIQILANELSLEGIPIYVPSSDGEDMLSGKVRYGKMVLSSFHQSKGIEWAGVILLNFDESSIKTSNNDYSTMNEETNFLHVAATRVKEHLVMIHHKTQQYLPFIDPERLEQSCEVVGKENLKIRKKGENKSSSFTVTNLSRHIPDAVMAECMAELVLKPIAPPGWRVQPEIAGEIENKLWESVTDITGAAITAIYEQGIRGIYKHPSTFWEVHKILDLGCHSDKTLSFLPEEYINRLRGIYKKENIKAMSIADLLFLANIYLAMNSGYIFKVLSIPQNAYTWVTEDHARQIRVKLNEVLPEDKTQLQFEKHCARTFKLPADGITKARDVTISGFLDICTKDNSNVWELKTGIFKPENFIQLALYCAIFEAPDKHECSAFLTNPLDGRTIQIKPKSKDSLFMIVQKLISAKTAPKKLPRTDDEFLKAAECDFEGVNQVVLPEWVNHWNRKK
ncbi:P-loop containing nucleoside triphosphate hydrolase protein [Trichophaea hybrida]|nr:P-loop containing nucleoside triphosphate hydrolase protein [Trichophaea hybrida]